MGSAQYYFKRPGGRTDSSGSTKRAETGGIAALGLLSNENRSCFYIETYWKETSLGFELSQEVSEKYYSLKY